MCHLTATEANRDLHPVPLRQELLGIFQFGVEIPHVNARRHPDLLDLHHVLVLSGFLLPLALLEPVFAVVHELAHRRGCLGRDLHQIQPPLVRNVQSVGGGHDTQLFTGLTDEADLLVTDLLVELMHYIANNRSTSFRK